MIIFTKIIATLIYIRVLYSALDPKYRYNEHQRWEPDVFTHAVVALGTGFMMFAIWINR